VIYSARLYKFSDFILLNINNKCGSNIFLFKILYLKLINYNALNAEFKKKSKPIFKILLEKRC
jgi:hypothetical protein